MRKILQFSVLLVFILALVVIIFWQQYRTFLNQPLSIAAGGTTLNVESGMSGMAVIATLAKQGLSEYDWRWRLLLRLHPPVFKIGEYRLEPGLRPQDLLRKLESGDVVRYRFTIVEGWTYRQLLDALEADAVLGPGMKSDIEQGRWQELEQEWGQPEGIFLPETYSFTRSENAADILNRAEDAMQAALTKAWNMRIDGHPAHTPYELLILASIIEKETAVPEERARISGVFVRRLKKGMRLQTDPTVIYGLGERFDGDVRRRDLETDTPYNTYTRHGLPPTPIAMPGRASLMAAAMPDSGTALYFVADGKGGHTFSDTLEEHRRAVDKLLGKN